MKRRLVRILTPLAVSAAIVGVTTPLASAAPELEVDVAEKLEGGHPDWTYSKCVSSNNGEVCYNRATDDFWVQDLDRDGNPSTAWWDIGARRGQCISRAGANGHWAYCRKNLPEGRTVVLWSLGDDGRKYKVTSPT
ncbi:hypothetical protein [Streptomyces sp. NRRL S-31]|uniref:hypothetical protein n=1 Tax=Streptomyces sp. NRRL S-31 TaxID=1463898 RepID=UPI00131CE158|nr:hypothetical protein [Streptomyces sp. NRRL S-31]